MFYRFAKYLVSIYYYLFYRIKIIGSENIPKDGGFILCSNHISANDPIILGITMKRDVHFLSKKELFKNKFFSIVLKALKTIPVDRGKTDLESYRIVLSKLKEGKGVGIFAQGTRVSLSETNNAKSGVALFALKGKVPVVPVCISSRYKLFSKIYVNYGKPISFEKYNGKLPKKDELAAIAENIMEKVSELKINI